ncbi:MAG: hypothetical protein NC301_09675, partial [Bacteroides sp.]|nr:hypothetical protein [Bacteroides sp.]
MDAINRQVIARLADIAAEVFATLEVEPGTYTAAELSDNRRSGDKTKRPIYELPTLEDWRDWANEETTVTAGSFVCNFPRLHVFTLLWKFEQLERVAQKEKKRFIREKEAEGLTFFVNIPKEAKNAVKFASADECRPVLCQILLDLKNSALVATDCHILGEWPVTIEAEESPELPEGCRGIYINPKHLKNLIGRVRVNVAEDAETHNFVATFTNEAGEVFINELNLGRFPDYRRVYPGKLAINGYIQLTPESVKTAQKLFKSLAKDKCKVFAFSVEEGATTAKIHFKDEYYGNDRDMVLNLVRPAAASLAVGFNPDNLINALPGWNGGMWIMDQSRPVVFDCAGTAAVVVMPVTCQYLPQYIGVGGEIKTLERFHSLPEGYLPAEPKKRTKKQISAVEPVEVAEPMETKPSDEEIIAFVDWLAETLEIIVKSFYRAEISRTVDRLRELATLAGVDILDILGEAVPPVDTVEIVGAATTAEVVEVMETTPEPVEVCRHDPEVVEVAAPVSVVSVAMVDVCRGAAPPGYVWPLRFGLSSTPRRTRRG